MVPQGFTQEITKHAQLISSRKYFSNEQKMSFVYLKKENGVLFLGLEGKIKKVPIKEFNKAWVEGLVYEY